MDNQQSEKRPAKRSRFIQFLIWGSSIMFVIAGLYSLNLFLDVRLKVSEETTLFTGPLKPDGQIDYLKVYEDKYSTADLATDRNGFRLIMQKVDLGEVLKGNNLIEVRRKLGLEPEPKTKLLSFTDPMIFAGKYAESDQRDDELILKLGENDSLMRRNAENELEIDPWEVEELITALSYRPWKAEELPMMATWLKQSSEVLDIYSEAVRKPVFELPFCNADAEFDLMLETDLYSQHFRSIARGFLTRANYFLGSGETRKAIDDMVSCRRMARHLRNQGGLVQRLIGVAVEGMATAMGIDYPSLPNLPNEDLAYFESEWNSVPELASLDHAILFEKLTWLDALQNMSQRQGGNFFQVVGGQAGWTFGLGINWNVAAREFNKEFDDAWGNRNWEKFEQAPSKWGLLSRYSRSRLLGRWFAGQVAGEAFLEAESRTRCMEKLQRITLAMLKYEKDHGHLPPAFTEDENNRRLHSWRVLLLPYLGEQGLYDEIKLDEHWDSEHNSKLRSRCPTVYACPSCTECKSEHTTYAVVIGKGLAFEGPVGRLLKDFGPDSDDLILVVERKEPANWLDPNREISMEKIRFDEAGGIINYQPMSTWDPETGREIPGQGYPDRIGSPHPAGAQFGLRNGSVQFFSETHDEEMFEDQLRGINSEIHNY